MKWTQSSKIFLGAVVLSSGVAACGEPEENNRPIDHQSAQQAIHESLTNISESISTSLTFLEESKLFSDNYNFFLGGGEECEAWDEWCEPVEPTPFDPDVRDKNAELLKVLDEHIFTEQNIENEAATSVTYLLKGDVVCAYNKELEGEELDNCVDLVDQAQIRLVASSPAEGSANLSVKLGPNRISPVSFEFHPKLISVSPDIGEIKKAADYLAPLVDADVSGWPAVAQGRLRFAVEETGPGKIQGKIGITQAIEISDGDYELKVAVAPNGFVIGADALAKTVSGSLSLGAISALFTVQPSDDFDDWDDFDDVDDVDDFEQDEDEAPVAYGLQLGGLTGAALLDAKEELLSLTGLGLGSTTSTMDINGKRVLEVDVNKENGRSFDVSIQKLDGITEFGISPALDLRLVMKLAAVQDDLKNIAAWTLDEILTVNFSGQNPRLRLIDGDTEILSGTLTLKAEKANITHVIQAGQCLLSEEDVAEDHEWEETEEDDVHPFERIEIGVCGE